MPFLQASRRLSRSAGSCCRMQHQLLGDCERPCKPRAAHVVVTNRKQRYVLPKLVTGCPGPCSFHPLLRTGRGVIPPGGCGDELKRFVLGAAGSPEQFGAPKPKGNIFEANITQSQFFFRWWPKAASRSNRGSSLSKAGRCASPMGAQRYSTLFSSAPATICNLPS